MATVRPRKTSLTPSQINAARQYAANQTVGGGNGGTRVRKPQDPSKRKLRVNPKSMQHASVHGIVGKKKAEIEAHLNDPRYKAKILADKATQIKNGGDKGYDMRFAKGKDNASLRKSWDSSLAKATSPGRIKGAIKSAKKRGQKMSAKQARSHVKSLHAVKFGVDPYHK